MTLIDLGAPVEHGMAPDRGARLTAAPPAVVGMCTFPVRAFART